MTIIEEQAAPRLRMPVRSEADLLVDQVSGIDAWARTHRRTDLLGGAGRSRELRLDLVRRQDVIARERQAMIDWTARQLRDGHRLRCAAAPRAVLIHRNAWFKSKVATGLQDAGITVVADVENGADGVGIAVAEQPDLMLVEDKLPMVPGLDVVREVRRYAPRTLLVAQVGNDWEIGPFLEAGAMTAYTRRIPPADIAADLQALLAT